MKYNLVAARSESAWHQIPSDVYVWSQPSHTIPTFQSSQVRSDQIQPSLHNTALGWERDCVV